MQSEAKFKEVTEKDPLREYEVLDNGDVRMIETRIITSVYSAREFITWYRDHEKNRDTMKKMIEEENLERIKGEIEKADKEVERLLPLKDESERKAKEFYEIEKRKGMVKRIEAEFSKPSSERNFEWLYAVYQNLSQNERDFIENDLDKSILNDFIKVRLKMMQQIRAGRRKNKQ